MCRSTVTPVRISQRPSSCSRCTPTLTSPIQRWGSPSRRRQCPSPPSARLGGSASHQKAILANLATSLFEHGRITTTEAKAKRLRPYAEKLITHAKAGKLANRREVLKVIRDKDIVHVLFEEIGPSFADRNGGYTRIIKTLPRKGDNARWP